MLLIASRNCSKRDLRRALPGVACSDFHKANGWCWFSTYDAGLRDSVVRAGVVQLPGPTIAMEIVADAFWIVGIARRGCTPEWCVYPFGFLRVAPAEEDAEDIDPDVRVGLEDWRDDWDSPDEQAVESRDSLALIQVVGLIALLNDTSADEALAKMKGLSLQEQVTFVVQWQADRILELLQVHSIDHDQERVRALLFGDLGVGAMRYSRPGNAFHFTSELGFGDTLRDEAMQAAAVCVARSQAFLPSDVPAAPTDDDFLDDDDDDILDDDYLLDDEDDDEDDDDFVDEGMFGAWGDDGLDGVEDAMVRLSAIAETEMLPFEDGPIAIPFRRWPAFLFASSFCDASAGFEMTVTTPGCDDTADFPAEPWYEVICSPGRTVVRSSIDEGALTDVGRWLRGRLDRVAPDGAVIELVTAGCGVGLESDARIRGFRRGDEWVLEEATVVHRAAEITALVDLIGSLFSADPIPIEDDNEARAVRAMVGRDPVHLSGYPKIVDGKILPGPGDRMRVIELIFRHRLRNSWDAVGTLIGERMADILAADLDIVRTWSLPNVPGTVVSASRGAVVNEVEQRHVPKHLHAPLACDINEAEALGYTFIGLQSLWPKGAGLGPLHAVFCREAEPRCVTSMLGHPSVPVWDIVSEMDDARFIITTTLPFGQPDEGRGWIIEVVPCADLRTLCSAHEELMADLCEDGATRVPGPSTMEGAARLATASFEAKVMS